MPCVWCIICLLILLFYFALRPLRFAKKRPPTEQLPPALPLPLPLPACVSVSFLCIFVICFDNKKALHQPQSQSITRSQLHDSRWSNVRRREKERERKRERSENNWQRELEATAATASTAAAASGTTTLLPAASMLKLSMERRGAGGRGYMHILSSMASVCFINFFSSFYAYPARFDQ